MTKINDLGKSKYFANKGLLRNKKPISNITYKVEILAPTKNILANKDSYEKYIFRDLGYLCLLSAKGNAQISVSHSWNAHGFVEPEKLKDLIGEKQWSKFCQGKRVFIIQRRENGKNLDARNI